MKNPFATKKIRYAILGAGHISQFALMPSVEGTRNSVMTAVITGDAKKARFLTKKYDLEASYHYDEYDAFLKSGVADAVYNALPNDMHADYTIRALKAGLHVLLEKPMSISEKECEAMIRASEKTGAKLMIAYRLHFEPATLSTIRQIRDGKLGRAHFFTSAFSQIVDPVNHRAQDGFWAGPVADMGTYPINACRMCFDAEPIEVMAVASNTRQLPDLHHDTVAVTLRFPEDRIAQFTVSYNLPRSLDWFNIAGDKGELMLKSAYGYGTLKTQVLTISKKAKEKEFKPTSQFGGELQYFSECILQDREPEPDGEEGYCDARIIAAIKRAVETGKTQKLAPYTRKQRIEFSQEKSLPNIAEPGKRDMKNVQPPGIG